MALFGPSPGYVGVDFDNHSIKIVELQNDKGRPRLVTYGYFDHDIEKVAAGEDLIEQTGVLIQEICRKSHVASRVAISALPAHSVFSSVITMPSMSQKELASSIKWEAKKLIPMPLEEMNIHWDVLGDASGVAGGAKSGNKVADKEGGKEVKYRGFLNISKKKDIGNIRVLLTAAPKDLVRKYIDIFKQSGLMLLSLDTESFALSRSLIGSDRSTIMLVDISYSSSSVMIVQAGIPYLNRSINVGGFAITRSIANSLNVNLKRAEQFKYDIGIAVGSPGSEIPKTIISALAPIIDEIKYSINLYKSQGQPQIEKIILTGGSALLNNLPDYLTKTLNMRVYLGDPWARVIYPEELKPALDEIGPRFSVAVGLAMKEIR